MNIKFRILSLVLVAFLAFLPAISASASDGTIPGQFVFGQSFTLESGQTMNGDLLVFGGSATIENGATVNGNVVVFGGSLTIRGVVQHDAVIFGGTASLGPTAHIYGSLSTLGSTLDRSEGALVDGQISNGELPFGNGQNGSLPLVVPPVKPVTPNLHINFNPLISGVANAIGQAVFLGLLAMLLMLFLAPRADRVAHAIIAQPLTAGGLGLLTLIVFPIALVLSVVTIILIPLAPIIAVAFAAALTFGWIAIGYEIGQRFTKSIHQEWHPAFSAGLGTFTLTLVAAGLTNIPGLNCIGWLVPFLLSLAAIGAVLMTRFGGQTVAPTASTTLVPPAPPSGQNPA
ncbi:MAG TPA: hypothetical protein VMC09_09845 [Anaerolineales bacterium]|nr:hypothetical protein [Anaerolineales bacterium]